ncbi:TetR family transcriptional regulator [Streptomyces sp. NPDC020412]|uniref:TetR family transcriptional regulator n=1 Tax=Streptomyces sp. NPDC020412 TaxID=3365073 RepID=UPI0037B2B0C0
MTQSGRAGRAARGGPAGAVADHRAPVRTRRPKDRRAIIARVAAELFAERGYAATGIGDIAERVGVTPGAIYRHFSGKEDLLRSVLQDALARFDQAARPVPSGPGGGGGSAEDRLREVVRCTVGVTLAHPTLVSTYVRDRASLSKEAAGELSAGEAEVARLWERAVHEVRPEVTPAEARVRKRAVNGVLALLARGAHHPPNPRLAERVTESLWALLVAPAAPGPAADDRPRRRTWPRPRSRREEIRDVAATLFRQYGYHGVGIDQIGKAAGISGPTVYGTYDSKVEILVDACDHAVAKLEISVERALEEAGSAGEALRLISRSYAQTVFADADVIAVAAREGEALPAYDGIRIQRRLRDLRQVCSAVLLEVRPDLEEAEARVLTAAANAAVQEVALLRRGRPTPAAASALSLRFLLPHDAPRDGGGSRGTGGVRVH